MTMGAVVKLREDLAPKRQTPQRRPNAELRTREHLTAHEVERLIEAAKGNRHGHRDATMILLAFRHGLRASELVALEWTQVDFTGGVLHVRRRKNGSPATHPLTGRELRDLRRLKRESEGSPYVFVSERGAPFSTEGFARLLQRAAKAAKLTTLRVHPHMLRHACGYKLANDGVDTRSLQGYLGHKNIQHTVRYSELSQHRFKNFWQD
jgi:type 1 fimbriae regulatory protein FimB/type 1 fimbriae regulatory protein FimE